LFTSANDINYSLAIHLKACLIESLAQNNLTESMAQTAWNVPLKSKAYL